MTRDQLVKRLNMAVAAGVVSLDEVFASFRSKGVYANNVYPPDDVLLETVNTLLEENNDLTPTPA